MPTGVYERDVRSEPPPASFDALSAQVRSVANARRAHGQGGFVGARADLREALRMLSKIAAALAESDSI
jgi:hypothetical protein